MNKDKLYNTLLSLLKENNIEVIVPQQPKDPSTTIRPVITNNNIIVIDYHCEIKNESTN